MRLVVPVDSQEIDGDASEHDGQADAAHHGLRVEREDEQEGPEDEVNHRPNQADLEERKKIEFINTHVVKISSSSSSSVSFIEFEQTECDELTPETPYEHTLIGRCMLGCLIRRTICPATVTP